MSMRSTEPTASNRTLHAVTMPAMLAVGTSAAANSALLPWLAQFVAQRSGANGVGPEIHVALLSAAFPFGAMLSAPLAGWFADHHRFRAPLILAVLAVGVATALTGTSTLWGLYALRAIAGLAFGVVVPLALLEGQYGACSASERARILTGLTASLFAGDLAGPLLAGISAQVLPKWPLLGLGTAICLAALLLARRNPNFRVSAPPGDGKFERAPRRELVAGLLCLTLIGTGGLSVVHLNLVLHRPAALPDAADVAWMLSLCGLAMLAAQLFHARFDWLVARPAKLTAAMLATQGAALWAFSSARSGGAIAASIFLAGWSAATLRVIASFWISLESNRSGLRLGIQHAVASVSQVGVPIAFALSEQGWHPGALSWIIALCLAALLTLPKVWHSAS